MTQSFKRYIVAGLVCSLVAATGCKKDFLDTVPDNITTLDNVFTNRVMSEQWLARIYSRIPDPWNQPYTTQWTAMTDEADYTWLALSMNNGALTPDGSAGYWNAYYEAIRQSGIFLKNIDKNEEMLGLPNGAELVRQYKGEARFLRAYYYFQLMKIYGPVVLLGEEPGDVTTDYQIPRSSWDECSGYVVSEMEKAKADVPEVHVTGGGAPDLVQTGRITKGVISAVQSQVLLFSASPLYNGNTDMADFKNPDGKPLLNSTFDKEKWKKAADAAKAVIDLNKWSLYQENNDDPFLAGYYSSRNLFWNGWKQEAIWTRASSNYWSEWERHCAPRNTQGNAWNGIGVFQELVDAYRMADGKGIKDGSSAYTEEGFASGKPGFYADNTSKMYVGREPRFYAHITFNGATVPVVAKSGQTYVGYFFTGNSGKQGAPRDWPKTGYTARKNLHPNTNFNPSVSVGRPAMLIRLAEIYLNYAEALNEYQPGHGDVLLYLNKVRTRAGLPALEAGLSQDEMREHIRTERRIELSFENHRYFDVRRWKVADQPEHHQGGAFYGMNMDKGTALGDVAFHQRTVALTKSAWDRRNYFWPVPQADIDRNKQLVQFPGY
ncbi:RagB/SusD family nutrient uptake outer membrane protein [Flavihumibacter stibioxidans]|uniref:Starch-binding associating with outer membrane n=1 Tax=Flavihumibacter stibioxidans TaxID=1834163 RepID=A0ABR7M9P2_9BACT|nr:RagB/SusD family nutrient uptake outer membrane protein [Flavihumibacter stibioxidans]MBC6491346.1 hypothetical protein [Flavihumibacter stibioxidans]